MNFLTDAFGKLTKQGSRPIEDALLSCDATSIIEELNTLSSLLSTRLVTKKLTKKWFFSVIKLINGEIMLSF